MPRNRVVRRSFGGGRRSPGRLTEWIGRGFNTDGVALAASTVVIDSSFNAAALAKLPFTITRVVGLLSIQSDQNAAIELVFGALGFAVVSDQAVAAGVASVPNPVTDVSSDLWHVYQSFAAEGSASTNVGRPIQHFAFDSRAQRKVEQGMDCVAVIANSSNTDGLTYVLNYRMLLKLS